MASGWPSKEGHESLLGNSENSHHNLIVFLEPVVTVTLIATQWGVAEERRWRMRRILFVLAAAALMAVMLMTTALSASAERQQACTGLDTALAQVVTNAGLGDASHHVASERDAACFSK
jgi:hypothetical protein